MFLFIIGITKAAFRLSYYPPGCYDKTLQDTSINPDSHESVTIIKSKKTPNNCRYTKSIDDNNSPSLGSGFRTSRAGDVFLSPCKSESTDEHTEKKSCFDLFLCCFSRGRKNAEPTNEQSAENNYASITHQSNDRSEIAGDSARIQVQFTNPDTSFCIKPDHEVNEEIYQMVTFEDIYKPKVVYNDTDLQYTNIVDNKNVKEEHIYAEIDKSKKKRKNKFLEKENSSGSKQISSFGDFRLKNYYAASTLLPRSINVLNMAIIDRISVLNLKVDRLIYELDNNPRHKICNKKIKNIEMELWLVLLEQKKLRRYIKSTAN